MKVTWVFAIFCFLMNTVSVNADDVPELVEVENAKKIYFTAVEKAVDELLVNVEKQLNSLSKLGKLDAVSEVQQERDKFTTDRILPKSNYLKNPRTQYERSLKLAESTVSRAYDKAIVSLTKRREIETAKSLKEELTELLAGKLGTGMGSVRVAAKAKWQPSEIKVKAGNVYRIRSKGSWRGSTGATTGPNGILSKPYGEALHDTLHLKERSKYLGLHPINSLIGRFGTESWSFFVGEECVFLSPRSDSLLFGFNDDTEGTPARDGSVNLVIEELPDYKWIGEKGQVQITGLIDSHDDLFITTKGLYWRHDAPWARVGQNFSTFPTIINGVLWFPDWTKGPDDKSCALLTTAEFGVGPTHVISDFKFKATLPDGMATITHPSATEAVIRMQKGNGIGPFPVTVTWEYRTK